MLQLGVEWKGEGIIDTIRETFLPLVSTQLHANSIGHATFFKKLFKDLERPIFVSADEWSFLRFESLGVLGVNSMASSALISSSGEITHLKSVLPATYNEPS